MRKYRKSHPCVAHKYYLKHKNRINLKTKEYYQKHKIERKIKAHEYYLKNKKKILNCTSLYRKSHKKQYSESRKIYRMNHPDYTKYCRKYRLTHKDQERKRNNIYVKNRNKTDICFKLRRSIRIRILKALKRNYKNSSTVVLLGCSLDFLRQHLQSQFKASMNWQNHGTLWHIDHIRPCASFDLSKESEQRKCFNYNNLQPLLAQDNLKKGCKT